MEIYDLAYLQSRVKFMVNLNKLQDATELVEREVDYIVKRCKEGRADIGYYFYKAFVKFMSESSCCKLSNAINEHGDERTIRDFSLFLSESISV